MAPPPPPPPPPLPELKTDAVSEILLRLSPDDPGDLVRASAVCKTWLQTITDPTFLHRYRAFHRRSLVLGFFDNETDYRGPARFVPTTAFRPPAAAAAAAAAHRLLDCRHGRVLLHDNACKEFIVWDPVTGHERCRIPVEEYHYQYTKHAVLCAAAGAGGCDHSTCSAGGGPFLLASVGTGCSNCGVSLGHFYSSETGEWSEETSIDHPYFYGLEDRPAALVGGALYFVTDSAELLRYDVLGDQCGQLLLMELPDRYCSRSVVMTAGDGGLGLATFDYDDGMLALWSAETDPKRYAARWSQIKLIDLQGLLPAYIDIGMEDSVWLSGFAEEANLIFLSTDEDGIYTIDLKSLLARKVCEMDNVSHVFPYVSYYGPAGTASRASPS